MTVSRLESHWALSTQAPNQADRLLCMEFHTMREMFFCARVGFRAVIEPWLVAFILDNGEWMTLVVEPETWVDKAAPHV